MTAQRIISVFAPAKINLFLHLISRRDDGYHTLDSLITFADIGDLITIEAANDFTFEVTGPFSSHFTAKELDSSPSSSNLVARAAWALSREVQKSLDVKITLEKNLPIAAGIGGGTADAAAAIWGLLEWWEQPKLPVIAQTLMDEIGADLPACFFCQTCRVQGIGEKVTPLDIDLDLPAVLVNPNVPCPTRDVFLQTQISLFSGPASDSLFDKHGPDFLTKLYLKTRNDLQEPAIETVPEISNVLNALRHANGSISARLSGSGATCFGIFESDIAAKAAAETIKDNNPDWWVQNGHLGRPERY